MARNSVHIKKSRLQYLLKSKQTNLIKLLKFKNVISSQWFQSLSTAAIAQTPRHHISAAEHQPSNLQKNYLHQKKKKKSFAKIATPLLQCCSLVQTQISAPPALRTYLYSPPACAALQLWAGFWMARTAGQGSMPLGKCYLCEWRQNTRTSSRKGRQ